jgi:hypothetical protein
MKVTKHQDAKIYCKDLKPGTIILGNNITLILSVTKEEIFWLNKKGEILHWYNELGMDLFDVRQEILIIENDA